MEAPRQVHVIGVGPGPAAQHVEVEPYQPAGALAIRDFPAFDVEGREIPYRKRAGGLVWFDFAALCGGPRSYADYVDLAQRFHTVLLSGVPVMSSKNAAYQDMARRFTWLVDVFYDVRVKLFVAAEAGPDELFVEGEHSAEFARAASRLTEMQSADYLQAERRSDSGGSGKVQGLPA